MSILAVGYYLEHCRLQGSEKLALIALANYADDVGECYPGVARIAHQLNMQLRPTQKILSSLAEKGELIILKNKGIDTGTGKTNRYVLTSYLNHVRGNPLGKTIEKDTPTPDNFEGMPNRSPLPANEHLSPLEGVISDRQGVIGGGEGMIGGSPKPSVLDPSVLDPSEKEPLLQDHPAAQSDCSLSFSEQTEQPQAIGRIEQPAQVNQPDKQSTGSRPLSAVFTPSGKVLPSQLGPEEAMKVCADKFANGQHQSLDGLAKQVVSLGVDLVTYREMTDAFLSKYGMLEMANLVTDHAVRVHTKAKETVLSVCGIDERFRSVDGLLSIFQSWKVNDWRGDTMPNSDQLVEHAGKMKAGAVKPITTQPTPSTPTPGSAPQPAQPVESMMHEGEKLDRSAILVNLRQGAILNPEPKEYNLRWIAKRRIWNAAYPDNPIPMPERWAGFADA